MNPKHINWCVDKFSYAGIWQTIKDWFLLILYSNKNDQARLVAFDP